MGRFFSNVQIKNTGSREQFISSFCDLMKKRNLVQCTDDEAEVQYILAFSEGGWVTLASDVYKSASKQAHDDAQQTAKEMNTSSFSMEVVDSDWAIIGLHTGADIHDTVIAGRSAFPEEQSPKGRQERWEQLLAQGKTWEQLSEIWNKNEVFVEDAMQEAASVLGIEPKYMISEYDDFNSEADTNSDILPLFYKKNITVLKNSEKKLTLNAAFKQVFGEALEPLGFVKMKGNNKYLLRLINNEILQIIALENGQDDNSGYKAFSIYAGIATIYRPNIDIKKYASYNKNWLKNLSSYYSDLFPEKHGDETFKKLSSISYEQNNTEDIFKKATYALSMTQSLVMPLFEEVTDLKSCLMFLRKFRGWLSIDDENDIFGRDNFNNHYNEGMLYIKTNYQGDFMELVESRTKYERVAQILKSRGKNMYTESYDDYYNRKSKCALERKKQLELIFNNPEKYEAAMAEIEYRKNLNNAILHDLKII